MASVHDHRGGADVSRRVTGLLQDLARRNPHAIVRRRDVDQVRRVHINGKGGCSEHSGVFAWLGRFPALRVAQKNLHDVGAFGLRCGQRILRADM